MARTRGRVASLLEVGTGFHLELTGRENVFLNGSILGMSRRDIAARFDSIVDFAGVERFIDTPVKRYSSGMYLRLAFAVAAHVEPDVLIVDEILAVGDAEFQRKCLDGMSLAEAEGRTLVFVSHDLDAIARLCRRALWMDEGRLRLDGETGEVLDAYLRSGRSGSPVDDDARGAGRRWPIPRGRVVVHSIVRAGRRRSPGHASSGATSPSRSPSTCRCRRRCPGSISPSTSSTGGGCGSSTRPGRTRRPSGWSGRVASVVQVRVPPLLNVGEYAIGLWVGSGLRGDHGRPRRPRASRSRAATGAAPTGSWSCGLPWEVRPAVANGLAGGFERSGATGPRP